MEYVPAMFKLERLNMLPVMRITGIASPVPEIEKALLITALIIIKKAEEFEGKPMGFTQRDASDDIPDEMASVRFFLIFNNEENYEKAISSLKEELG